MNKQNFLNPSDAYQQQNFAVQQNSSAISISPQSQLQMDIQRNIDFLMGYRA
jgi:hypothetical protein